MTPASLSSGSWPLLTSAPAHALVLRVPQGKTCWGALSRPRPDPPGQPIGPLPSPDTGQLGGCSSGCRPLLCTALDACLPTACPWLVPAPWAWPVLSRQEPRPFPGAGHLPESPPCTGSAAFSQSPLTLGEANSDAVGCGRDLRRDGPASQSGACAVCDHRVLPAPVLVRQSPACRPPASHGRGHSPGVSPDPRRPLRNSSSYKRTTVLRSQPHCAAQKHCTAQKACSKHTGRTRQKQT